MHRPYGKRENHDKNTKLTSAEKNLIAYGEDERAKESSVLRD
jgi:hypothetical protein